jgi:AcrR family transcriptional regulator
MAMDDASKGSPGLLKIADLVRLSGTGRSTIHFYLNSGLLPPPIRRGPKLHFYGREHLSRLREIAQRRGAGTALAEIGRQFAKRDRGRARREAHAAKPDEPKRRFSRKGLRDGLLDAAARAFVDRGYDGVHVEDVARAVGVSKARLYELFPSKAALFVASLDRLRHVVFSPEARAQMVAPELPFADEGRIRAAAVLARFPPYRMMTNLLAQAAFGGDAELAKNARTALHTMILGAKPMFDRAVAAGDCRPIDTELVAYMTWGALMAVGDRLALDDKYTTSEGLEAYLDFVTNGNARRDPRTA